MKSPAVSFLYRRKPAKNAKEEGCSVHREEERNMSGGRRELGVAILLVGFMTLVFAALGAFGGE